MGPIVCPTRPAQLCQTQVPAQTLRCDCGAKKAAELHPQFGLTIRFGHGSQRKHQATLTPRQLLGLLSGTDRPEAQLAYVVHLLGGEP